jgi:hypothetical protein
MFSNNTDPVLELLKTHQQSIRNEAHLRHLLRALRGKSRKRITVTETPQVSCTIYPKVC